MLGQPTLGKPEWNSSSTVPAAAGCGLTLGVTWNHQTCPLHQQHLPPSPILTDLSGFCGSGSGLLGHTPPSPWGSCRCRQPACRHAAPCRRVCLSVSRSYLHRQGAAATSREDRDQPESLGPDGQSRGRRFGSHQFTLVENQAADSGRHHRNSIPRSAG